MLRPVHATFRVERGEFFYLPLPQMWERLVDLIRKCQEVQAVSLHALLLMSNHIHLLYTPAREGDEPFFALLIRAIHLDSRPRFGRKRVKFGISVQAYEIASAKYFHHAVKYIYRNPVDAGLCGLAEEYPYSTLQMLLGLSMKIIKLQSSFEYHQMIPQDRKEFVDWLNKRAE